MAKSKITAKDYRVGWRFGVLGCTTAIFLVFLFNFAVTLWVVVNHKRDQNGQFSIFRGSCSKSRSLSTGLHLLVNILSTIILGASNYCLQCLSAPSREEIDRSHPRQLSLDVGVRSIRNLGKVLKWKIWVWLMLAITTLPLHLFYNSTIISSIGANDYYIYSVNEDALVPQSREPIYVIPDSSTTNRYGAMGTLQQKLAEVALSQYKTSNVGELDNLACIDAYDKPFQTSHGNVLLVSSNVTIVDPFNQKSVVLSFSNSSALGVVYRIQRRVLDYRQLTGLRDELPWQLRDNGRSLLGQTGWSGRNMQDLRNDPSLFGPFGNQVTYCVSEPIEETCRLSFNLELAIVVVVLNFVKVVLMVFVLFFLRDNPLLTVGDAVSSFLSSPDETIEGMCLRDGSDFRYPQWKKEPVAYNFVKRRWSSSVRKSKWSWFYIWMFLLIGGSAGGVAATIVTSWSYGAQYTVGNVSAALKLGLGSVQLGTLVSFNDQPNFDSGAIARVALIVNLPQVVLSVIHFFWNGVLTRMLSASEWNKYATQQKGLRVSSKPSGHQRDTYFLSVPYRYGLPFMMVFAVLHWLLSQSLFPVAVERNGYNETLSYDIMNPTEIHRSLLDGESFVTIGFSPLATLIATVLIFMSVVCFYILGRRRLSSGIPLTGNSSAAISAACHPNVEDGHAISREKLQGGCFASAETGPRHCSFSSKKVELLQASVLYA